MALHFGIQTFCSGCFKVCLPSYYHYRTRYQYHMYTCKYIESRVYSNFVDGRPLRQKPHCNLGTFWSSMPKLDFPPFTSGCVWFRVSLQLFVGHFASPRCFSWGWRHLFHLTPTHWVVLHTTSCRKASGCGSYADVKAGKSCFLGGIFNGGKAFKSALEKGWQDFP